MGKARMSVLFVLAFSVCSLSRADTIDGLFATGVDDRNQRVPVGEPDPHYTMNGPESPDVVIPRTPPEWVIPPAPSNWIGPSGGNSDGPDGEYVYTIVFGLEGLDRNTASISGLWSADNDARIRLNGITVGSIGCLDYGQLHRFGVERGFVPGTNTLEFVVTNRPTASPLPCGINRDVPNPTGLLIADISGQADQLPVVEFIRGDANNDGTINISDPVVVLNHLFATAEIDCGDAADSNDDGVVNITDPIGLLNFLFGHGLPPGAPFPGCEIDPEEDDLDCVVYDCA